MKINKDELKRLAEKSDAELWASITEMAKAKGYDLKLDTPSKETIEKIRRALMGTEKLGMMDAARIINNYKNKN